MVAEGFTWKDSAGRSLTLSGQVNPAFNVVDDGISTDVFIVDNDTSGTRFRLDADAPLGETSIGATLEIGASPNNSYDVSQLDSQTDADFNVRRAEVTFRDDRYGRLQLGKGSSRRRRHRRVRPVAGRRPDHVRRRRRHRRRHPLHRRHRLQRGHRRRRLLRLRRRPPRAHPLRQPDVRPGAGLGLLRPGRPVGGGGDARRRLRRLERLDGRQLHPARRGLGLQPRGRQRRLRLRRLRLGPARPDRPQPDALHRRPEARRGRRPVEPLRQARLGHRALVARPHRLRHRLHPGREHQRRRRRRAPPGASRRCSGSRPTTSTSTPSSAGTPSTARTDPDLKDITVGTFGTKFAF